MNPIKAIRQKPPTTRHMLGWILICILGVSGLWLLTLIATDSISVSSPMAIASSLVLVVIYAILSALAIELVYS
jgi:uncharacterized membrane protein